MNRRMDKCTLVTQWNTDVPRRYRGFCHKASITIKQVIIFFAGGRSCLQFVKNAVSEVQYNEVCLYYAMVEMNELFLLATT